MAKPNVINKADIIMHAKECIVDNGIEKFTLRAVADRAGVTQGTVYYHFRTKEQLLLELVQDACSTSWEKLSQSHEFSICEAIQSAKSRCTHDSFYHKLFFTLFVSSLNNTNIRNQLEQIIHSENKALSAQLARLWPASPVDGVSLETWGVLLNAIVDGLAMQALIHKDFPVDTIYGEVETLFSGLSSVMTKEESS